MRGVGRARSLLFTVCLVPTLAGAGTRWDWTPEERACALQVGVQLGGSTESNFLGHLTWLADVVVTGTATRIEHDLSTGFPTTVTLAVETVHKGEGVPGSIEIFLNSGPFYSKAYKQIIEVSAGSRIEAGERVLVFLTGRTHIALVGWPREVALLPHQFGLLDGKWTVQADGTASFGWACATPDEKACGPERNHPVAWMEKEIERARIAQATMCRARD